MDQEKVIDLLCERVLIEENDPAIYKIWEELTELLSRNVDETICFLKGCTENQLYYISEIFEDISYNLKSPKFIQVLYDLNHKYPELNMESDIELAKEYME
ncbi:hypothetical protein [Anaerocolumna jejuensis]|uniref:hypothetical protein n=1 Tax=Anaerocolumna jejuensis TaxID=259063 RepID=UPI003F7CC50F